VEGGLEAARDSARVEGARRDVLPLRRVLLDVDKPIREPSLFSLIEVLGGVSGVEAVNVTVEEMDVDVMGLLVVVEGDGFSFAAVEEALDRVGAVIHSVDQIIAGDRVVEMPNTRVGRAT